MAKPNRRLTSEQFAESTTIDGSRIETAQDEMVDRFNNLENIDIKRRFTQTNYVFGYLPPINSVMTDAIPMTYTNSCAPWMRTTNDNYYVSDATVQGWSLATTDFLGVPEITNKKRVKGNRRVVDSFARAAATLTFDSFLWSNTWYFGKPVIIDAVSFAMITDHLFYKNNWKYGVDGPPRSFEDQFVDLVMIEIIVDNPYVPENKSLTNIIYKKNNYQVDCEFYQYDPGNSAIPEVHDMVPTITNQTSSLQGYWSQEQNLNISVPEKSRVTLNINIPFHDNTADASGFAYGEGIFSFLKWNEWEGQNYSGCLTVLEETE